MRQLDLFRHARANPVRTLILTTLFLVFWTLVPLADLLEGTVRIRGGDVITAASDPFRFWLWAICATAAEIIALCQMGVAADAWLNPRSS